MMDTKIFVFCACFLAALCSSYADSANPVAPPAPATATVIDAKSVVPETPATIKNATVLPAVAPTTAANITKENVTEKVVVTPTVANNATQNSTGTNSTQTPVAPINKPVTQAPPAVVTTVAPTKINVTEVPPKTNVTPCMVQAPTMAPVTAPVEVSHGRYFDGLSFIGGMVLAVGLLGIGRVAFKVYKNRSDSPNYLTL